MIDFLRQQLHQIKAWDEKKLFAPRNAFTTFQIEKLNVKTPCVYEFQYISAQFWFVLIGNDTARTPTLAVHEAGPTTAKRTWPPRVMVLQPCHKDFRFGFGYSWWELKGEEPYKVCGSRAVTIRDFRTRWVITLMMSTGTSRSNWSRGKPTE